MLTHAFTCTGPYAVLIMLGIKRTENRGTRPVAEAGRCAVSCSKSFCKEEYGAFVRWASTHLPPEDFERVPAWTDVKDWPGKVVGACDYRAREAGDGALGDRPLPWDEGLAWWWDLSEVVCLDVPIACRGNVGMWEMPPSLAARVTAADALARCVGERVARAADAARLFRLAMPVAGANEGLFVLPLDVERRVLSEPTLVSLGEPTTTAVNPADVFALALKAGASAVVVAHNHPSGNPAPSAQDARLTDALKRLGDALGVKVLDHLVLT